LRFATVLATFLFIATVAVNGLAPAMTSYLTAAPGPAIGMGGYGGGGGGAESAPQPAPAATEAPILPFAALAPTETTPLSIQSIVPTEVIPSPDQSVAPTETPFTKNASPELVNGAPSRSPQAAPVPLTWQFGLAVIAIILGAAAWAIRRASESKFRKQWK